MKPLSLFYWLLSLLSLTIIPYAQAETVQVDAQLLRKLERMVEQQQEQLQRQAKDIAVLRQQVEEVKRVAQNPPRASAAPAVADAGQSALPEVTSGRKGVQLNINGHANRAVSFIDDGKESDVYSVDNAVSGSRINFVATADIGEGLKVGSRIEIGITPESSFYVAQDNKAPGDNFSQRWAEVYLESEKYGKLSIGKGDTASNTTAESDLSQTQVVQNSSIADLYAAMKFRESAGDQALSSVEISDAFFNLDGLHRQSRLRYDTPEMHGFRLATSLVSNERSDAGLFWQGQGGGFKAIAAAGIANPNIAQAGYRYDGSFSILHQASGLSLSSAYGEQQRDTRSNDSNLWGKLGWTGQLNSLGKTAFGVGYTRTRNMPEDGAEGQSVGAAAVQFLEKYDTELFVQYRHFELDRDSGTALEDLDAATLGARLRF